MPYFVYGLQAIGKPSGPVKIGFSAKPITRLIAHEPGALGERLHVIFQIEAGPTYGDGRRLEKAYHDEFAAFRLNREWFRFDPRMLTWVPDGSHHVYAATRSPAANTLPAKSLERGDPLIFRPPIVTRPPITSHSSGAGDLTPARSVQQIIQRNATVPRRDASRRLLARLRASLRGSP